MGDNIKPISVQLYSLREEAKVNPVAVIERLAKIGYKGVEPAGFYDLGAAKLRKVVEDNGMVVSSSHGPWVREMTNVQEAVDTAGILGLDCACTGFGQDQFKTLDEIKKTAEKLNGIAEALEKHNIKLFIHNHWWEYVIVDGKVAYDHFAALAPKIWFEIDAYWASNFQANDPAKETAKLKKRTLFLHIKDGPLQKDTAMMALGTGKLDIPPIIHAADPSVLRWVIVELDRCDTDMFTAIEQSYKYLTTNKLAVGNK
ncbi:MAG: sugar phosphate isomerase/epimerase [Spirochaetes bacterium]|nr:sugar phosphate isomerase/epimerase [Spirochaetota bacterium]